MKEQGILYDKILMSERLEDLRKGDGKKKHTRVDLAKEIEEKTGVSISSAQIGKYENPDKKENMNINFLIAFANFYNVSVDYLLGRTKSKSNNYTSQMTSKKYSLTDNSMKKLETLTNTKNFNNNEIKLELINCIIENEWFIDELLINLYKYYSATEKSKYKYVNIKEQAYVEQQINMARFDLIATFEKFRDENKEKIYKVQKPIYLFDMPEQKKSKKKEKK